MHHHQAARHLISIHALREEGDVLEEILSRAPDDFYPRPPRGGRRVLSEKTTETEKFLSTPSARRATTSQWFAILYLSDFYPRPPRGGRLNHADAILGIG